MEVAYLRVAARRCQDLSNECFDLTVAGKLRRLGESLEAKAREIDEARRSQRAAAGWIALRQRVRQIRLSLRERLSAQGAQR